MDSARAARRQSTWPSCRPATSNRRSRHARRAAASARERMQISCAPPWRERKALELPNPVPRHLVPRQPPLPHLLRLPPLLLRRQRKPRRRPRKQRKCRPRRHPPPSTGRAPGTRSWASRATPRQPPSRPPTIASAPPTTPTRRAQSTRPACRGSTTSGLSSPALPRARPTTRTRRTSPSPAARGEQKPKHPSPRKPRRTPPIPTRAETPPRRSRIWRRASRSAGSLSTWLPWRGR